MKYLLMIQFSLLGCIQVSRGQSCEDLPLPFTSYSKAIKEIRNADFKFTDQIQEGSGSWIISAEYFSCDDNFGYLVFTTDNGYEYIHEEVPKTLWLQFKKSNSRGSFYNSSIKNKYRLIPK